MNPAAVKARGTFLPPNVSHQEDDGFPSSWLNGFVLAIFTFLIGWAIAMFTGRPVTPDELKLTLWSVITGPLALIANKINIRAFLNTFRTTCVDKMLRVADMENLEKWLSDNFNWWKPLLVGIWSGPCWVASCITPGLAIIRVPFSAGPFVTIVLCCIQAVWVGILSLSFLCRLSLPFEPLSL